MLAIKLQKNKELLIFSEKNAKTIQNILQLLTTTLTLHQFLSSSAMYRINVKMPSTTKHRRTYSSTPSHLNI